MTARTEPGVWRQTLEVHVVANRDYLTLLSVLAAVSLFAAPARSETTTRQDTDDGGYGYIFEDDLLGAGLEAASSAMIRLRPGGLRKTLIRPRYHFVPELLHSIRWL